MAFSTNIVKRCCFSQSGTNVSCILYILFPLAAIFRDERIEICHEGSRFVAQISAEASQSYRCAFTGGDPLTATAKILSAYIEPLLGEEFSHIRNIRIGSKTLAYWPYRFLTDKDADDLLALFEKVTKAGKHLAFQAHFNHPIELSTDVVKQAIRKIKNTGAQIRTQSPLLRHQQSMGNMAQLWREQVSLGLIPYYMFVARDTGLNLFLKCP